MPTTIEPETLVTRAGVALHVRPVGPADVVLLQRLYAAMTPEDLRARFLGTIGDLDEAELRGQLDRQGTGGVTFVATGDDGQPLAAATLVPDPQGHSGEVAIAVRSDRKGQGIGWTMLEHVRRHARAIGLRALCSIESGDNRAALDLEREAGFAIAPDADDPRDMRATAPLAA
jgi:acetyltransferase